MPIYNKTGTGNAVPVKPIEQTPSPTPATAIGTASVYSTLTNPEKIFTAIEGTPWTIPFFYTQWVGTSDVVGNSGDIQDPTLKQYTKINNYEIRVTSPLSPVPDTQLGTTTVSGEANTYPGVVPMIGDVFIAILEDNYLGVFEINNVVKGSIFGGTACSISYQLKEYVVPGVQERYDEFVINELFFDATKLDSGSNPLFTKSEIEQNVSVNELINNLIEEFIQNYYSINLETFLRPISDSKQILYDPFIVNYWLKYIDGNGDWSIPKPLSYTISNAIVDRPFSTVLDAIGEQNPNLLKRCIPVVKIRSTAYFDAPLQRNSIRLTSIQDVVYIDSEFDEVVKIKTDGNEYYIFSENFYNDITANQTPLEILVLKVINSYAVSFTDVKQIYNNLYTLPYEDKFYIIPLIITLLMVVR